MTQYVLKIQKRKKVNIFFTFDRSWGLSRWLWTAFADSNWLRCQWGAWPRVLLCWWGWFYQNKRAKKHDLDQIEELLQSLCLPLHRGNELNCIFLFELDYFTCSNILTEASGLLNIHISGFHFGDYAALFKTLLFQAMSCLDLFSQAVGSPGWTILSLHAESELKNRKKPEWRGIVLMQVRGETTSHFLQQQHQHPQHQHQPTSGAHCSCIIIIFPLKRKPDISRVGAGWVGAWQETEHT